MRRQVPVATGQTNFLKVVVRGVEIDAAFVRQHGYAVTWNLPCQQCEHLYLVQRLLPSSLVGCGRRALRRAATKASFAPDAFRL